LSLYLGCHSPGNPAWCGTQYRSAIFTLSQDQQKIAEAFVDSWGVQAKYISVENSSDFYRAEEYHQKYMEKL